jgi:hypothetical protein
MGISQMLSPLQPPTKEVDVDFLVFVERYATDLLKWDILTFFSVHPNLFASTENVARRIGRNAESVRPELADLALLGILEQTSKPDNEFLYQLTREPNLRRMALRFSR